MRRIYICEDSVQGIFSGIYDAWKEKKDETNGGIVIRGMAEQELFCEYAETKSNPKKAAAVEKLIRQHLGMDALERSTLALLTPEKEKGDAVFRMMLEAKRIPDSRQIMQHISHPSVRMVFELSRRASKEAHAFVEFIRFRELENGVLYSEIAPKCRILTCIGDHFANRLPNEHFLIYDKANKMMLVHRAKHPWIIVQGADIANLDSDVAKSTKCVSGQEETVSAFWESFFESISIKERENKERQRGHLPMRFRPDMVEFHKDIP